MEIFLLSLVGFYAYLSHLLTVALSFNQENIQTLTASIQELRNLVADYIQGRSQL